MLKPDECCGKPDKVREEIENKLRVQVGTLSDNLRFIDQKLSGKLEAIDDKMEAKLLAINARLNDKVGYRQFMWVIGILITILITAASSQVVSSISLNREVAEIQVRLGALKEDVHEIKTKFNTYEIVND